MKALILESYAAFTALFPFVLAVCLGSGGRRTKPLSVLLLTVFAVYIAAVLSVTGAGTLYDCGIYGLQVRTEQLNLLLFSQEIDKVAYLQNILLFVPLGLLLPLLWPDMRKLKEVFINSFGFSLLLELSQLCNNRCTDVDDLLLNTLGALMGYGLAKLLLALLPGLAWQEVQPTREPCFFIAVMFCGRFLLFHEMGIARLLYGF